jgi:long-chain acyl-CoA synthetase
VEKVWLKNYPPGIPQEIDTGEYQSLGEMFQKSVDKYRDRPAYTNLGRTLSYDDVDQMTRDFAAYLTQLAGLKQGDRIAIMMPNLLQYPIALFGALRAGLIVVNTNPLYTDRELAHQLKDSGAKAIVIVENFAGTLASILHETDVKTIITTQIGDLAGFPKSLLVNFVVKHIKKMVPPFELPVSAISFNNALAAGKDKPFSDAPIAHQDLAFLQYTGGTTGVAKGAALTHKNMIANVLQVKTWGANEIDENHEIFITALPLYHIFSLTANAFSFVLGAKSVLITNPRDMSGFVKELGQHKFTFIAGVNTLFNGLLNTPGFETLDFSHLKLVLGGGMAVQESVANEWQKVTGTTLIEAYGLTETSPGVCINPTDNKHYSGSIGLPLPSTEVCIKGEDGRELGFNEPGELCVKGPQVMQGYWNRPKETANVMDQEGWLHTGDIAVIDEAGFVKLVDRLKDLIIVSGFNVYPNEVENVVASHPKVLEVGAIGVPHKKSGETVKLFVVKKDDSLTKEELVNFCRQQMTGYKCPKHIEFVKDLPKSNVGKVLRKDLRKL